MLLLLRKFRKSNIFKLLSFSSSLNSSHSVIIAKGQPLATDEFS